MVRPHGAQNITDCKGSLGQCKNSPRKIRMFTCPFGPRCAFVQDDLVENFGVEGLVLAIGGNTSSRNTNIQAGPQQSHLTKLRFDRSLRSFFHLRQLPLNRATAATSDRNPETKGGVGRTAIFSECTTTPPVPPPPCDKFAR